MAGFSSHGIRSGDRGIEVVDEIAAVKVGQNDKPLEDVVILGLRFYNKRRE